MPTEDQFIDSAREFLAEIGADTQSLTADTHLFDSGLLDSLGTLAFLDFVENLIGDEIDLDSVDVHSFSTLRNTYQVFFAQ